MNKINEIDYNLIIDVDLKNDSFEIIQKKESEFIIVDNSFKKFLDSLFNVVGPKCINNVKEFFSMERIKNNIDNLIFQESITYYAKIENLIKFILTTFSMGNNGHVFYSFKSYVDNQDQAYLDFMMNEQIMHDYLACMAIDVNDFSISISKPCFIFLDNNKSLVSYYELYYFIMNEILLAHEREKFSKVFEPSILNKTTKSFKYDFRGLILNKIVWLRINANFISYCDSKKMIITVSNITAEYNGMQIYKSQRKALDQHFTDIWQVNLDLNIAERINDFDGIHIKTSYDDVLSKFMNFVKGEKERFSFLMDKENLKKQLIKHPTYSFVLKDVIINNKCESYNIIFSKVPDLKTDDFIFLLLIENVNNIFNEKAKYDEFYRQVCYSISKVYPFTVSLNLSANSYSIISNELIDSCSFDWYGKLSELIDKIKNNVSLECQKDLETFFTFDNLLNCYKNSKDIYKEIRIKNNQNVYVWRSIKIIFIDNPYSSDMIGVLLSESIDEKKQLEQKALELENIKKNMTLKYLNSVAENYEGVFEIDFTKDMVYEYYTLFGEIQLKSLGLSVEDYVESRLKDAIIHPSYSDVFKKIFNKPFILESFNEGKTILYSTLLRRFDNNIDYSWCYYTIKIYSSKDSLYAIVYLQNIDYLEKTKESQFNSISKAKEEAINANLAKTGFIARMSHDLRTPMNAIIEMTEIAKKEENSFKTNKCLEKIETSADLLLSLINDVLDLAMIESGTISFNNQTFSLYNCFSNLVQMMRLGRNINNRQIILDMDDMDDCVVTDEIRLQQIGMNIIGNSIKFTPDDGIIKVSVKKLPDDDLSHYNYSIVFSDNGYGMSKEFLENVYKPFEREKNREFNNNSGVGLGMSIVKNLVEKLNGTISVTSEIGVGTEFTIKLKLLKGNSIDLKDNLLNSINLYVYSTSKQFSKRIEEILVGFGVKYTMHDEIKEDDFKKDYNSFIVDDYNFKIKSIHLLCEKYHLSKKIIIASYNPDKYYKLYEESQFVFLTKPIKKKDVIDCLTNFSSDKGIIDYKSKRVLIVEDLEINVEIAKEALKTLGLKVDSASNGEEAYDLVLSNPLNYYNLILMDIEMPIMDGYLATKKIREIKRNDIKDLPIIAMTANAFKEDVNKALTSGMNAYITKPIKFNTLLSVVKKFLTK